MAEHTCRIHPAIGVTRLGNSDEYYLAPETPAGLPLDPETDQPIYSGPGLPPQSIFRDASGALKKQAARFKVFVYDDANPVDPGTLVQVGTTQVHGQTVTGIEWMVYLANKKASWFRFEALTGSGLEGDGGYQHNNASNPGGGDKNLAYNALRYNKKYGASEDPATIADPVRKQLILDPGPRTVSGAHAPSQEFTIAPKGLKDFEVTRLGRIFTDGDSNLIVLGGDGNSGTTDGNGMDDAGDNYANHHGWFDDTSDGPVSANLILADGTKVPVDVPSWVLCGPPGYAPEVFNAVTLYDTMYDVCVREFGLHPALYQNGTFQANYQPNFTSDIQPFLRRPNLYKYVVDIPPFAQNRHAQVETATSQQFAQRVLGVLRDPDNKNTAGRMPKQPGDNPLTGFTPSNYLTLTATQYFILTQYAHGNVSMSVPPPKGEGIALDQASLENCVGGNFCPGIEMNWICRNTTIYMPLPANPSLADAFRIRHKDFQSGLTLTNGADNDYSAGMEPGDLTKYMGQPWQADFNECSVQTVNGAKTWWWPAQRPYYVYPAADQSKQVWWTRESDTSTEDDQFPDMQMVTNWKDLGFILNVSASDTPNFVEIERNQTAISAYPLPETPAAVAEAPPPQGSSSSPV